MSSVSDEWPIQAYTEKYFFIRGKRLGKYSSLGGFLVAILLHAGSRSVFPALRTAFQLLLHLIRAE